MFTRSSSDEHCRNRPMLQELFDFALVGCTVVAYLGFLLVVLTGCAPCSRRSPYSIRTPPSCVTAARMSIRITRAPPPTACRESISPGAPLSTEEVHRGMTATLLQYITPGARVSSPSSRAAGAVIAQGLPANALKELSLLC